MRPPCWPRIRQAHQARNQTGQSLKAPNQSRQTRSRPALLFRNRTDRREVLQIQACPASQWTHHRFRQNHRMWQTNRNVTETQGHRCWASTPPLPAVRAARSRWSALLHRPEPRPLRIVFRKSRDPGYLRRHRAASSADRCDWAHGKLRFPELGQPDHAGHRQCKSQPRPGRRQPQIADPLHPGSDRRNPFLRRFHCSAVRKTPFPGLHCGGQAAGEATAERSDRHQGQSDTSDYQLWHQ